MIFSRLSSFTALLRFRDLGYVAAALIGGLLVAAMPSGALSVCPSRETGSDADYLNVVFAALTFLATILIAVVAHGLNATLKATGDRKAIVAARMYCRIAGPQIRNMQAACAALQSSFQSFIDGDSDFAILKQGVERVPFEPPHSFLYENEVIGHLSDSTVSLIGDFCAEYLKVYDTVRLLVKGAPDSLPPQFADLDARVQNGMRQVKDNFFDLRQKAAQAKAALELYLDETRNVR